MEFWESRILVQVSLRLIEDGDLVWRVVVTILRRLAILMQMDSKSWSFVRCTKIWVKVEIVGFVTQIMADCFWK